MHTGVMTTTRNPSIRTLDLSADDRREVARQLLAADIPHAIEWSGLGWELKTWGADAAVDSIIKDVTR